MIEGQPQRQALAPRLWLQLSGLVIEGQPQPSRRLAKTAGELSGLVIEGQPQRYVTDEHQVE